MMTILLLPDANEAQHGALSSACLLQVVGTDRAAVEPQSRATWALL